MIKNKELKKRIISLSYKLGLSHIGSCLTAVDIIADIYEKKKPNEKFILSAGHAGLALYVLLEKYYHFNALALFEANGVHPDRIETNKYLRRVFREMRAVNEPPELISCSTGSLGMGISISVGVALANRNRDVYCLISDGECAEGVVGEALRIWMELKLFNLKIYVNDNGYAAYRKTPQAIYEFLGSFNSYINVVKTSMNEYPEFLQGNLAHYKVLDKDEYEQVMKVLE